MKSYIFAAAAIMAAVAHGAVLRREEDCEDPIAPGYGSSHSKATNAHPGQSSLPCGATSSRTYTVAQGDTLGSISHESGAGICDIAVANNITDINFLALGQVLIIPVGCTSIDNSTCIPVTPTATCVEHGPSNYTIVGGDTLTSIAQKLNITLPSLLGDNAQITNPDLIEVNQIINVPVCGTNCGK